MRKVQQQKAAQTKFSLRLELLFILDRWLPELLGCENLPMIFGAIR
jgi:hypothetical protein